MKLSQLNVALTDLKGNPSIRLRLFPEDEEGINLVIEKTKLKTALKEKFVERNAETGLTLRDDGFLSTH